MKCDCNNGLALEVSSVDHRPGDKVYAIGNPKGLLGTFSEGIISGFRDIDGTKYVQITASISSGSSGGPVVDENGRVIGVTTASIKDGQNLNLAMPLTEDLAYALYRIARVSKPRTLAVTLVAPEDAPPAGTPAPARSYSVQIIALAGQQKKLADYFGAGTDLMTYYARYNNTQAYEEVNELLWTNSTTSDILNAVSSLLEIYQSISTAGDRARTAPILKRELSSYDGQLTTSVLKSIDNTLKYAQHVDTIRFARKLREEVLSCQSLLQSIKIE